MRRARSRAKLKAVLIYVSWKAKELSAMAVWGAAMYAALPLVAVRIGEWVYGSAIFEGPFLLASPFIAIWIGAMVFRIAIPWFDARNQSVEDPDIERLANRYAKVLNLAPVKAFVQPDDGRPRVSPVGTSWDRILIYAAPWHRLSDAEREFALAHLLAMKSVSRGNVPAMRLLSLSIFVVACIAATQNLWSILGFHTISVLWLLFVPMFLMRRTTLRADALALRLTRNLDAAIQYIRASSAEYPSPGLAVDQRVVRLRMVGAELGLA